MEGVKNWLILRDVINGRPLTFMQDENGERDENSVDVTEPDEHGVRSADGVLLNLWNLIGVDQTIILQNYKFWNFM